MKSKKMFNAIGNISDKYIKESEPHLEIANNGKVLTPKRKLLRRLPVAACITLLLFASTAFAAAAYIQSNISSFYLRYLFPEDMAVSDSMAEKYGAKVYFDGLKSDDIYKQYFSINKLVEYYNDEKIRLDAIRAITPFLDNSEEKLSDAATFALSVLTETFDDPRIIHMADGSLTFTLFNDYGSYNKLWQIKDGELTESLSFNAPHMYIRHIIPSPDAKLLAIMTSSNKSGYIVIYDAINGYVSKELIDSARILVAKDMGYAIQQRIDFENYSGVIVDLVPDENGTLRWGDGRGSINWADNNTLEFKASLRGDVEEIEEFETKAVVRYNFQQKHMEYSLITE